MTVPDTRVFGKTTKRVSIVGLGGEGILRTFGADEMAASVINAAFNCGITYFDSARAYAGSEGYYGAFWHTHRTERSHVFQTSKSACRDYAGACSDLQKSLSTLGTDYLDLWQIHDVRSRNELREIESPSGALSAFIEARETGLVHAIGVTGHHDPAILTHAVKNWPVDSVLLPVNPVEGIIGGFLDSTLPAARETGIGVIGMKVMGASRYIAPWLGVRAELLIRYALSHEITCAIVGCSSPGEVRELVSAVRMVQPLTDSEIDQIHQIFRPYARKLAYYRGIK